MELLHYETLMASSISSSSSIPVVRKPLLSFSFLAFDHPIQSFAAVTFSLLRFVDHQSFSFHVISVFGFCRFWGFTAPRVIIVTRSSRETGAGEQIPVDGVIVKGMMCNHCEARVKKALEAVPGIESAVEAQDYAVLGVE